MKLSLVSGIWSRKISALNVPSEVSKVAVGLVTVRLLTAVNASAASGTYNVRASSMAAARPAPLQVPDEGEAQRARWVGWVAAARFGDKAAFASLHGHFAGMVHAIAISRV